MPDFELDDIDLSPDDHSPLFEQDRQTEPVSILVAAALGGTNTTAVRHALESAHPHVILITTPSSAWARALSTQIEHAYRRVSAHAIVERKKDGNFWLVDGMLARLAAGKHMVLCSPDPQLLPGIVLAAVDVRLALPPLDAKSMRKAIGRLTGTATRSLTQQDYAGLDLPVLQAALRPGSRAIDCLRRLRHSVEHIVLLRPGAINNDSPVLDALPLSADIADWAKDMVGQLKLVTEGKLSPGELRFGVLAGPPGTGKTLVAGAVAKSAGWSFYKGSFGEWFTTSDGHLGGMTKAISGFFDQLIAGDCVVGFIDEIDSLPSRGQLEPRDLQWWGTVINLMLTQTDRARASGKKILLIAATNYIERLDPALVRAGRLEQRIEVQPPRTPEEVLAVFAHYLKGEIDPGELGTVVRFALGATPASIAGWVRAARAAARRQNRALASKDVMAAVAPPDLRSSGDQTAVALHEAGHAIVARSLGIGVDSVSIVASGRAGGVTRTATPSSFPNWPELEDQVTVLLAGRAADIALGTKGAHAGAAHDLEVATSLLLRGLTQWGLGDNLSYRETIDDQVLQMVDSSLKRLLALATDIILEHQAEVNCLAAALLEHRLLTGPQIDGILDPGTGVADEHPLSLHSIGSKKRPGRMGAESSSSGDFQ
jgi:DNA polymerase III delta prime subunit